MKSAFDIKIEKENRLPHAIHYALCIMHYELCIKKAVTLEGATAFLLYFWYDTCCSPFVIQKRQDDLRVRRRLRETTMKYTRQPQGLQACR